MTRGRDPTWADTPYARWIKQRLNELEWNKDDLAGAIAKEDRGESLHQAGAAGLVTRVTAKGRMPAAKNRALIARVLGPEPPGDRPGSIEGMVLELAEDMRRLTRRVRALERRAAPGSGRG